MSSTMDSHGHDSPMTGRQRGSHEEGFPWSHVIGYVLSLILTFAALVIVENTKLSGAAMVTYILIFAGLQVFVQLFFFMHFTETVGPRIHIVSLSLGLFFTMCVILGSIWIMSFSGHQAY